MSQRTDHQPPAGNTPAGWFASYWRALLALLPCNRDAACGLSIVDRPARGPRRRS